LQRRLSRSGYSVEVAESGQTALDMISKAEYDLVLLDQMMPGMSGLDLLKLLRTTYSTNELPIIMVTAVDQKSTIVEALDQGANDYVAKPIDMPLVLARIQAQLTRSKADQKSKLCDSLTGLNNRLSLSARLAEALATGAANVAVMEIDLDGFKSVNDSFGRSAGDQVLVEVANRLKDVIEELNLAPSATLARVAGDEFAILIERVQNSDQLKNLAETILSRIGRPITAQGSHVEMSSSIGIARGAGENVTPEYMLRDANLAVYRAKELGKNRWSLCEPMLRERAETHVAIATGLRRAVEQGELFVVYQPKVKLKTGAIVGFEALLRWNHPERGLMHPSDFIPVAEETGVISAIGEWILGQACRQLKVWQEMFPLNPPLNMNVNLSVKQLGDPNLIGCLKGLLLETGIAPQTLKLELTESALMPEISTAREALASIKALRIGLKLDDFGTGYSSLSYLRKLHLDSLKIDKSFVDRVAFDPGSRAIVETVLDLAQALNMNVVAVGIENLDQLRELIKLGCETGQGFYFSKPLKTDVAQKLLASKYGQTSDDDGLESWAERPKEV
jgi:diguanylate cyclase (GGDEF)-like protein